MNGQLRVVQSATPQTKGIELVEMLTLGQPIGGQAGDRWLRLRKWMAEFRFVDYIVEYGVHNILTAKLVLEVETNEAALAAAYAKFDSLLSGEEIREKDK